MVQDCIIIQRFEINFIILGSLLDFQVYSLERLLNLSVHSLVKHVVLT